MSWSARKGTNSQFPPLGAKLSITLLRSILHSPLRGQTAFLVQTMILRFQASGTPYPYGALSIFVPWQAIDPKPLILMSSLTPPPEPWKAGRADPTSAKDRQILGTRRSPGLKIETRASQPGQLVAGSLSQAWRMPTESHQKQKLRTLCRGQSFPSSSLGMESGCRKGNRGGAWYEGHVGQLGAGRQEPGARCGVRASPIVATL
jgi:hypothetical protein